MVQITNKLLILQFSFKCPNLKNPKSSLTFLSSIDGLANGLERLLMEVAEGRSGSNKRDSLDQMFSDSC